MWILTLLLGLVFAGLVVALLAGVAVRLVVGGAIALLVLAVIGWFARRKGRPGSGGPGPA